MVKAIVTKHDNMYVSFKCEGHAGFARKGKDIVCAAISALTTTTLNSIEQLTSCPFKGSANDGFLEWEFIDGCDERATLLMDSLIIGLNQISNEYSKLLRLEIREV